MEFDGNTYYVTPDSLMRNAVNDHRVPAGMPVGVPVGSRVPIRTNLVPAGTVGTTAPVSSMIPQYQYPTGFASGWSQGWPQGWPQGWAQQSNFGFAPPNPGYFYPPTGMVPSSNLASILGGFGDLGSLATIAAQILAAFLPLPASPTPQDSSDSDAATNAAVNSSNLIRYQNALANYARRDQQILTVGSVLKELLKRPGFALGA